MAVGGLVSRARYRLDVNDTPDHKRHASTPVVVPYTVISKSKWSLAVRWRVGCHTVLQRGGARLSRNTIYLVVY